MGFSKDIYLEVLEEKRKNLQRDDQLREHLYSELKNKFPRVAEIDKNLSDLGMQSAMAAFSGNKNLIEENALKVKALQEEKAKLFTDEYKVEYKCNKCLDKGYLEGKYCDCVHAEAKMLQYKKLSSVAPFDECSFDSFSLSFYPEDNGTKVSPKLRMEKTVAYLKKYVNAFPTSENLLLFGGAGLGKTHLSIAIASEVIKKGYGVFYCSAEYLMAHLERERFNKFGDSANGFSDAVNDCDLLVLDDLGTEYLNQFTKSQIYDIINTRLLMKKPTIINTNLTMEEIEQRYTPRISSRLIGNYTPLLFEGNDIRQLKD